MFLCWRLIHEHLGHALHGIPQDAKTCCGLILESSGLIFYADFLALGVFGRLALFHRYENKKLMAFRNEKISA